MKSELSENPKFPSGNYEFSEDVEAFYKPSAGNYCKFGCDVKDYCSLSEEMIAKNKVRKFFKVSFFLSFWSFCRKKNCNIQKRKTFRAINDASIKKKKHR